MLDELIDIALVGNVADEGDNLSGNILAMNFLDLLELLKSTADDAVNVSKDRLSWCWTRLDLLNLDTVYGKCLSGHQANTASSTGDESDLALHVKDVA